jgi:hypothetical protein
MAIAPVEPRKSQILSTLLAALSRPEYWRAPVPHPGKYPFASSLQVRWLTNAAIEFAAQETVQEYYRK